MTLAARVNPVPATDQVIAGSLVVLQILFFFDSSALLPFLTDDVKNVITFALLALIGALCLLKLQGRALVGWNARLTPLLLFVLAYTASLLYQPDPGLGAYYAGKISKMLLITLPTVLAVNVVRWTPPLLAFTVRLLGAALLVVTLDGAYQLWRGGPFVSRDASFGIDPISLGRSAGFCVLLAFLSFSAGARSWRSRAFTAVMLVVGLAVLFASGSRGPLIALGAALLVVFLGARSVARRLRIIVVTLVAVLLGGVGITTLSAQGVASSARVLAFLQGDVNVDRSAETRSFVYEDALAWIPQHLLGSGQGAAAVYLPSGLRYPHNLLLEVQLEGGVVCALLLIAAVAVAFVPRRGARAPARIPVLASLTFLLMNSMFSGDVSSNRLLFLLLALASVPGAVEDA